MSKPHILIADDSSFCRNLLVSILGNGYHYDEAVLGLDVFRVIEQSNNLALIVLDLHLPDMNGLEILRRMHEHPEWSSIPVIVNTVDNAEQNELTALRLGAIDFITKPYHPEIIRQRVASIIERRELERVRLENARLKEQETLQRQLHYSATHDILTDIYNALAFYDATAHLLADNPNTHFVMVRWDIERFRVINEVFGTKTGDRLLKGIAEILKRDIKGIGTYGRLGSDHFAMCVPEAMFDPAVFLRNLDNGYKNFDINYDIISSLGIYSIDEPELPVARMCDRAQLALNTAKGKYVARYAYYDDTLRASMLREQELSNEMNAALAHGQFQVYFQPIYSLSTSAVVSAEALVRWIHPTKGMLPPNIFIPLFERNGFITNLDVYVWEETCKFLSKRCRAKQPVVPISVNLSRLDFYDPHLCDLIIGLVETYQLPPSLLKLEITESIYSDNARQMLEVMSRLQEYGFEVLMDDFGSGYSSLNMLKDVPVDILKIDMRFLEGSNTSTKAGTILSSIFRMARWLGMKTVTEGVETQEQVDFLRSIGGGLAQGYFFAKPMPRDNFATLLDSSLIEHGLAPEVEALHTEAEAFRVGELHLSGLTETVQANHDGILLLELSAGQFDSVRANEGYYSLFNITPDALFVHSKQFFAALSAEDEQTLITLSEQAHTTQQPHTCFVRCAIHNKAPLWLEITIHHVSTRGERRLICMIMRDVTNVKTDPAPALSEADAQPYVAPLDDNAPSHRHTVLIADDIFVNREILRAVLDKHYTIIEAENGQEALERLQAHPEISIAILDVVMPRMSGLELLATLRKDPRLMTLPVLVMTQFGEESNELEALRLGAIDFLEKPFKPEIVLQRLHNVARRLDLDALRIRQILLQHEQQRKLNRLNELCRVLMESSSLVIADYDYEADTLTYSLKMGSYRRVERHIKECSQYIKTSPVLHPEDIPTFVNILLSHATSPNGEATFRADWHGQGTYRWQQVLYKTFSTPEGAPYRTVGMVQDIHDLKQAKRQIEQQKNNFYALVSDALFIVSIVDGDTPGLLYKDYRTAKNFYPYYTYFAKRANELVHEHDRETLFSLFAPEHIAKTYASGKTNLQERCRFKNKSDDWVWVDVSAHIIQEPDSKALRSLIRVKIIQNPQEYSHKNELDPITGLYSSSTTEHKMRQALSEEPTCSLLLYSINNMTQIMKQGTVEQNKALWQRIEHAFSRCFRKQDILGCMGIDTIAVLLIGSSPELPFIQIIEHTLQQLQDVTKEPPYSSSLSACVGVAHNRLGLDFVTLHDQARQALCVSKQQGNNCINCYTDIASE